MKDIEKMLAKDAITPQREPRDDFTKNILRYLNEHPRKTKSSFVREFFRMKYYKRPVFAVFAILALAAVGSTAYAAVGGWPNIEALFGGQKKVENARVVKVDTKNCKITNAFTINSKDQKQNTYYFKVKDDSKLTNDQVVQIVKGYCELDSTVNASLDVSGELNKNPLNKDAVVGGYIDSVVTAIDGSSVSIESQVPVGDEVKTFKQRFTKIDPQVIVYEGLQRLAFSDIKIGDHISVAYRASGDARAHSETINPASVNGEEQVIVAIAKNSKDFTAAIDFQKYNGKEFEQVVVCPEQASGFCTVEQYLSK